MRGRVGLDLLEAMTKEELLQIVKDDAKLWLAHDGLWFQAVEAKNGMEDAIHSDREAWRHFSPIEAQRIMSRLGIEPGGGIPALVECINHRLYARLNLQVTEEVSDKRAIFKMIDCRVQSARRKKSMDPFPCKTVGIVEYTEFAKAVDPRIETRCITCPPDEYDGDCYCGWEFAIPE